MLIAERGPLPSIPVDFSLPNNRSSLCIMVQGVDVSLSKDPNSSSHRADESVQSLDPDFDAPL